MMRRTRQQIFHCSDSLFARSLVLFEDDRDLRSGRYIFALAMGHF